MSSAIDIYRSLIEIEKELEVRALALTPLQMLSDNCPRCFGPLLRSTKPSEPDYIVCVDGNLQHRRHEAASVEDHAKDLALPSMFVPQELVNLWANRTNHSGSQAEDVSHSMLLDRFLHSLTPFLSSGPMFNSTYSCQ